jgi:hypothetical protein
MKNNHLLIDKSRDNGPYRFFGLLGLDIEGGDIMSEAATDPGLEMSPPSLI